MANQAKTITENLHHTYMAAIQFNKVRIPEHAHVVGVVRTPMYGFQSYVDTNKPALAPPESLLNEMKIRADELEGEGLDAVEAHNTAIEEVNMWSRYDTYLQENEAAQAAMQSVKDAAKTRPVYLVCYENTEEKGCHRTHLIDQILSQTTNE